MKYIFLSFVIFTLVNCTNKTKTDEISVNLKLIRRANCSNFCHQLKVTFTNNTAKCFYISNSHVSGNLIILDSTNKNILLDYLNNEMNYYKKNIRIEFVDSSVIEYDGVQKIVYDSNQISEQVRNQDYKTFFDSAVNKELNILANEYVFDEGDIKHLSDIFSLKYEDVILLKPHSIVYELIDINTLVHSNKEYNIYFTYEKFNNQGKSEIKIPGSNQSVRINENYLERINEYQLFIGRLKSNNLFLPPPSERRMPEK